MIQEHLGVDLSTQDGPRRRLPWICEQSVQERCGDEPKGCFRYSPEPNVELVQVYKWPAVLDLSGLKRAQYDESLLFATMEAEELLRLGLYSPQWTIREQAADLLEDYELNSAAVAVVQFRSVDRDGILHLLEEVLIIHDVAEVLVVAVQAALRGRAVYWRSNRSKGYETLRELRVEQHPDKTFVGWIKRGFTFLGYWITEKGVTGVAPATWDAFQERVARLYEQNAPLEEIRQGVEQYVRRWERWLRSGLGEGKGGLQLPLPTPSRAFRRDWGEPLCERAV